MAGQGRRSAQQETTRVFELARELEMTSRQVLFHLELQGEPRSTAVSTVGHAAARRLRMRLENIDGLREVEPSRYAAAGGSLGADHPSVRAAERRGGGGGEPEGEADERGQAAEPLREVQEPERLAVVLPFRPRVPAR